MSEYTSAKRLAVKKAAEQIKEGYVVGLGSGTTIAEGMREIAAILKTSNLKATFIPSSHQIELAAISHSLRLGLLAEHPQLDLAIDGADQVDQRLNLIKGGGAALAREKVIDVSAKRLLIVVDERKLTSRLGEKQPVPVEVLPFACQVVMKRISNLGGRPVLREGNGKVGPTVTDNGNFIVDSDFGPIGDPQSLELQLRSIPGIVETGLFLDMTDTVYVGKRNGTVQTIQRKPH